jgi:hypothetical protein
MGMGLTRLKKPAANIRPRPERIIDYSYSIHLSSALARPSHEQCPLPSPAANLNILHHGIPLGLLTIRRLRHDISRSLATSYILMLGLLRECGDLLLDDPRHMWHRCLSL